MCICLCLIYIFLPLFVLWVFEALASGGRPLSITTAADQNQFLTSEGLIAWCGGQTSSEEDSPGYKQGPFSQRWDNKSLCVFAFVGWNGGLRNSCIRPVFFFKLISCRETHISDECFIHFYTAHIWCNSWHLDSSKFNSLKGNENKEKSWDFPTAAPYWQDVLFEKS